VKREAIRTEPRVGPAVSCQAVWKIFRIPNDRPRTLKQRILHPSSSRSARNLEALREVSFQIEPGEFFGIIGRNGSGKSTLLKCLAGIYLPTHGTATVGGRVSPFIELGVGFNPELTALDNIVVNAALLGISPKEARADFREIIRFAELEEFEQLKLKNYSSGMYVRLGFAAAIQAQADIYLVDEVLAVGDARFQEKCFDTFRRMKRTGRTVIYVTHDLATVERFCDRALLLEGGEVAGIGDPTTVIRTYRQHNLREEQAEQPGPSEDPGRRWGDGAAEIVEAWFEAEDGSRSRVFPQGSRVFFRARIRFNRPFEDPVFGVIIKNERSDHVFVTNTIFDEISTGQFSTGEEVLYSVALDLHLADGVHTASPAVAYQDAQRFADWQEEVVTIVVRGDRHSGGIVELPHDAAVEPFTGPSERQPDEAAASSASRLS
jgi:ABC-type polysaccharide/polyol phosphate transport system ATPase subunit